ncbi:MAG: hypothetical protein EOO81_00560 [Oxalobacteraceae bacterium]|nr:MAG: hypothetical protein EOO81_00560 [Oxalobacteraceae bacterium]
MIVTVDSSAASALRAGNRHEGALVTGAAVVLPPMHPDGFGDDATAVVAKPLLRVVDAHQEP